MYKVLIADSSQIIRELLKSICIGLPFISTLYEAEDGPTLMQAIKQFCPDVVICEVELSGISGIEAAEITEKIDPNILFIFIASNDSSLRQAVNVYAYDYLVKPIELHRLVKTLRKIHVQEKRPIKWTENSEKKNVQSILIVDNKEQSLVIHIEDIILITKSNRKLEVICKNKAAYYLWMSLEKIQEKLPPYFFRSHKGFIININFIREIQPYGQKTFQLLFTGCEQTALITQTNVKSLKQKYCI